MANYWKEKVLPKIKKVFEKTGTKKAAAAEAIKAFDETKEQYTVEFEEKKTELQPKVIEVLEASSTQIKALVKEPKEAGLKKQSAAVQKFLDDLAKIEFPGSKAASEASSKFGPAYVPGPVFFVFEKVSTFIVVEEKKEETPVATAEATTTAAEATVATEATTEVTEKDIVVEEKKEETTPKDIVEETAIPTEATAAAPEESKVEELPKA